MDPLAVLHDVRETLSYLPGELAKHVDEDALVKTVQTSVQGATNIGDVFQAIIDSSNLIFPGTSLYAKLAIQLLGGLIRLLSHRQAAAS